MLWRWCSTNGFTAGLLTDGCVTPIVSGPPSSARQPGDFKGRSPLPSTVWKKSWWDTELLCHSAGRTELVGTESVTSGRLAPPKLRVATIYLLRKPCQRAVAL